MSATNEREESPFELLENDQRRVVELLSRMAEVLEKVEQKRLEFRSVDGPGQRFSAELGLRSAPRS